jgi:two-component system repressor protein LuxO
MKQSQKPHILLIEDSLSLGRVYQEYLKELDAEVTHVTDGQSALDLLGSTSIDIVLVDLNLPDMHGLDILAYLHESAPQVSSIVITAHGSVDMAVEAIQLGAYDFLQKPFDAERLRVTVKNVLEKNNLLNLVQTYQDQFERDHFHGFVGASLPMQAVYRIIESAAPSSATIFITGESGTGKEVCAQAIHAEGNRRDQPFIALNCAAIPRDLMESEIFGHVKGAFTGASSERQGAASLANGGTLFLDEIGEMDMDLQSKLLRFIQTGTFQKVGSSKSEKVDVRFICATNRDPLEMVSEGRFREDLYYRLHVIPIQLPPLRERGDDVLQIAQKFLQEFSDEEGKGFTGFSPEVVEIFEQYQWPGNIRELLNVLRNTVVLNTGSIVDAAMLPAPLNKPLPEVHANLKASEPAPVEISIADSLQVEIKPLWQVEKDAILQAIEKAGGNVPRAAAMLEVSPSTVYRKLQSWE